MLQMGFGLHILERTLVAIIAVVFGVVALIKISRSRGLVKGRWLAIVGLTLGCVYLPFASLLLVQDHMLRKSNRARCLSNMKFIGIAIAMYADEHDGYIPRTFDDLRRYRPNLDEILICPSVKNPKGPSYQILLAGKKWNTPEIIDAVVMTEPMSNHRGLGHNQLFGDGHCSWSNLPDH
jgi:hypothetical protein